MVLYRFYSISAGGHITSVTNADCANDEDALSYRDAMLERHEAVEIWQGSRFVGKLQQSKRIPATTPGPWWKRFGSLTPARERANRKHRKHGRDKGL